MGFVTADRIAISMGIDPHSEYRIRAALFYLLNEAANGSGHTYLPHADLVKRACDMLKAEEELVSTQISQSLLERSIIGFSFSECEEALCLPSFYYA